MVVGIAVVQLGIEGTASRKDKRNVVKKIISRTQNKFNLSISEVDDLDCLNRATIGFSSVCNDARVLNSRMDKIMNFIEGLHLAEVLFDDFEIIRWEHK